GDWRKLRPVQCCLWRADQPLPLLQAGRDLDPRPSHRDSKPTNAPLPAPRVSRNVQTLLLRRRDGDGPDSVLLTGEFAPESLRGIRLSGNAFNFLGVPPLVGRTIQPSDIRPGGEPEPVVVLSFQLWQSMRRSASRLCNRASPWSCSACLRRSAWRWRRPAFTASCPTT